jgi:hypothetical protein
MLKVDFFTLTNKCLGLIKQRVQSNVRSFQVSLTTQSLVWSPRTLENYLYSPIPTLEESIGHETLHNVNISFIVPSPIVT